MRVAFVSAAIKKAATSHRAALDRITSAFWGRILAWRKGVPHFGDDLGAPRLSSRAGFGLCLSETLCRDLEHHQTARGPGYFASSIPGSGLLPGV